MSKTEILDELPKLTRIERQEIRLRLAELDGEAWLDEDPLSVQEALVEAPSPLTRRIQTPAAHGKKLKGESEAGLMVGWTDETNME